MVTDEEVIECVKTLGNYCLEHNRCEGCMFRPKNYTPVKRECLIECSPPCDILIDLKNKGEKYDESNSRTSK